ncbi:MAG: precorrin-2 C(20)-methyltransferase [Microcystaceae cyanobacterium]
MKKWGIFYGVSVGTGDPELITVKGLRILQQVKVIALPAGLHQKPGIAEGIIAPWLQPEQIILSLDFPYVQSEETLKQAWQRAGDRVFSYLEKGQDVAFACEGDISFYSTFTYLAEILQQAHPSLQIERIPGISSPFAAASALGIPLTIREQRLAVLPAIYHLSELETAIAWADVIVLMKFASVYEEVWRILAKYELLERAYVVEKATFPDQVIYRNLDQWPQLKLSYFSLLIIQN